MNTIDQERAGLPLFVTLTYPGEWPGDPWRWKRDLQAWLKRLKRAQPEAWGVWRLEPQKRGAPHYHLLVFGALRIEIGWLSQSWFEVVGSGDDRHLRAGTQVQAVLSWRRVIGYASKYLAKEIDELPEDWHSGVGRWWGVHQRGIAPRECLEGEMRIEDFYRVRRVLRRLVRGSKALARRWAGDDRQAGGLVVKKGIRAGISAPGALRLLEWVSRERWENERVGDCR